MFQKSFYKISKTILKVHNRNRKSKFGKMVSEMFFSLKLSQNVLTNAIVIFETSVWKQRYRQKTESEPL